MLAAVKMLRMAKIPGQLSCAASAAVCVVLICCQPGALANNYQLSKDQKLQYLCTTVDKIRSNVFTFWLNHGLDGCGKDNLGFHGTLSKNGTSKDPTSKGLIQESRHLYAMVMYYEFYGKDDGRVKDAIYSLYNLLVNKYMDKADYRFIYKVNQDGSPIAGDTAAAAKQFTPNMFTIMALARMGRVLNHKGAAKYALKSFKKWDELNHDTVKRGWGVDGVKDLDTMLHTLEALTELWMHNKDCWYLKPRLAEAVTVIVDKILLSSGWGYSRQTFNMKWAPTGTNNTDFGHELVASWMLLNLEKQLVGNRVISKGFAKRLRRRAIATAEYTFNKGWDSVNGGGIWQWATPEGQAGSVFKMWWQQAEGLSAAYKLYQVTKADKWLHKAYAMAKWIWDYQTDQQDGEWYWSVNATSLQGGEEWPFFDKGLEWKASYHTGRAAVFMSRWVKGQVAI